MNGRSLNVMLLCALVAAPAYGGWPGDPAKCPADSVKVGATCIDKYEASLWQVPNPTTAPGKKLIGKIQKGKATLADLTAGGAVQLGCTGLPFNLAAYPANFPSNGNWTPVLLTNPPTPGVYAVSIPGVLPSTCITWFQAEQACALSNKRLVRSQEWQRAAMSTPDPGTDNGTTDCAVSSASPVNTGARTSCQSAWGLFDMVGNVSEWVGDWADRHSGGFTDWTSSAGFAGNDRSAFGGDGSTAAVQIPAALVRGGNYTSGVDAGVFAVSAENYPSDSDSHIGLRCAR